MNRYAEIGSPWRAAFSRLKYFVVKPLFNTHDSCSYNKISIQPMKFSSNSIFLNQILRNYDPVSQKLFLDPLLLDNCLFSNYLLHLE